MAVDVPVVGLDDYGRYRGGLRFVTPYGDPIPTVVALYECLTEFGSNRCATVWTLERFGLGKGHASRPALT